MEAAGLNFQARLDMARAYIGAAEEGLPLLASGAAPEIDSTSWRLSSYITAVVLIYGALERFLDETLVATAGIFNVLVPAYADLPEAIKESHLTLTVQVMGSLDNPRWDGLTAADLSRRLAACLNGSPGYELNVDVFKERNGNYRHRRVREVFKRLGIGIPEEVVTDRGTAILTGELSGKYARMSSLLEDLVQRRNEAAHGLDVLDVLDFDTLRSITDAVEAYAYGVRSHVVSAICQTCMRARPQEVSSLGAVAHTWTLAATKVRSIADVTQRDIPSRVGDVLMVGNPPRQRVATIGSIGWGKRRLKTAPAINGRRIALELGRQVSNGEPLSLVTGTSADTLQSLVGW